MSCKREKKIEIFSYICIQKNKKTVSKIKKKIFYISRILLELILNWIWPQTNISFQCIEWKNTSIQVEHNENKEENENLQEICYNAIIPWNIDNNKDGLQWRTKNIKH